MHSRGLTDTAITCVKASRTFDLLLKFPLEQCVTSHYDVILSEHTKEVGEQSQCSPFSSHFPHSKQVTENKNRYMRIYHMSCFVHVNARVFVCGVAVGGGV